MRGCWIFVVLLLPALSGRSMADDLVGKASVIDGDTLEIDATRIRLGELMRRKTISCAEPTTASSIDAAQGRQLSLPISLRGARLAVSLSVSIKSGRHLQYALWMASTSGTGSSGTGSRWIGRNIRKANMTERNETLIMLDVGSGKEAT
jgi:hypothetical protein